MTDETNVNIDTSLDASTNEAYKAPETGGATQDTKPTRTRAKAEPVISDYATLVRGSNYALKFQGFITRWTKGAEKKVSPELREYLERTALDTVTVNNGGGEHDTVNETRPKFTFDQR